MAALAPSPEGSSRTFHGDVARIRHNALALTVMGVVPFGAMFLLCVTFLRDLGPEPQTAILVVSLAFAASIATALVLWLRGRRFRARYQTVEVHADPEGLRLDGVLHRRHELTADLVSAVADPCEVRLERRFRPTITLRAESPAEARSILFALGLDASQNVTTYHGMSRLLAGAPNSYTLWGLGVASPGIFGLLAVIAIDIVTMPVVLGMAACSAALVLSTATRTKLVVSAEGVRWSWLGLRRFIGFGDIKSIWRDRFGGTVGGLVFQLTSGERLRYRPTDARDLEVGRALLDQLEERIREAMASYRAGGTEGDAGRLARGGREMKAWLRSLRTIGSGANADARTAAIPREHLFRIVEDSSTGGPARAAAAVALGMSLDAEGRARVRSAATATAAPKLRVALEVIAEGAEDNELVTAMAEVEVEAEKARPFE